MSELSQAKDSRWLVYCGAYTEPFMFTESAECSAEFVVCDSEAPDYVAQWVPCPHCGAECFVDRSEGSRAPEGANP